MHKHIAPAALLHFSISKCCEMRLQLEDKTPASNIFRSWSHSQTISKRYHSEGLRTIQKPDRQTGEATRCRLCNSCGMIQLTRNRKSVYANFLAISSFSHRHNTLEFESNLSVSAMAQLAWFLILCLHTSVSFQFMSRFTCTEALTMHTDFCASKSSIKKHLSIRVASCIFSLELDLLTLIHLYVYGQKQCHLCVSIKFLIRASLMMLYYKPIFSTAYYTGISN